MAADPQRPDWVTDELLAEFEDECLAELAERLTAGGRGTGTTLSAAECSVLAELVAKRPPRKRAVGHPRRDINRTLAMRFYYIGQVLNGASVEAAVTATAKEFGVSRSTVFAARKRVESE